VKHSDSLVSPDGVVPSRMVSVSASVNLPLHHKVQKFSSGTGSPGWSQKKGRKTVVVVVVKYIAVYWCDGKVSLCECVINAVIVGICFRRRCIVWRSSLWTLEYRLWQVRLRWPSSCWTSMILRRSSPTATSRPQCQWVCVPVSVCHLWRTHSPRAVPCHWLVLTQPLIKREVCPGMSRVQLVHAVDPLIVPVCCVSCSLVDVWIWCEVCCILLLLSVISSASQKSFCVFVGVCFLQVL